MTWYGSAIEGKKFENVEPVKRYDESTSEIAIGIGKLLNYSPKKIHYLLDQYSGVIGDFVLPMTTKKAEKGVALGNFTIDPVTSNALSDRFYDMYYEAQYAKNDGDKTAEYQVRHLNKIKSAISDMYDEISKIQNSDKSDKEKLAEIRTIQIMINEMYKTAINDYELVTNAIEATSSVDDSYRYTEVTRLVYGAERALREYDDDVYAKAQLFKSANVDYEAFYNAYFATKGIESDKDKYGNTISGSKRNKVVAEIVELPISREQKMLLIASKGYSIKSGDIKGLSADSAKAILKKYIKSLNCTKEQKKQLAKICGIDM